MPTFSGRLIRDEAQVAIETEAGTFLLAVRGANPVATAAGRFAAFGQTQPVTVKGEFGRVDGIKVFFVSEIDRATQDLADGGQTAGVSFGVQARKRRAAKAPAKKKAARKKSQKAGVKKAAAKKGPAKKKPARKRR